MAKASKTTAPSIHIGISDTDRAASAQGGDAAATVRAGWRPDGPIIVNSSRAILYASNGADFAAAARREAQRTRDLLQAAIPQTRP